MDPLNAGSSRTANHSWWPTVHILTTAVWRSTTICSGAFNCSQCTLLNLARWSHAMVRTAPVYQWQLCLSQHHCSWSYWHQMWQDVCQHAVTHSNQDSNHLVGFTSNRSISMTFHYRRCRSKSLNLSVTSGSSSTVRWHQKNVTALCWCEFYQLQSAYKVTLTVEAAHTLVQALVSCHLDYCNSLLYSWSDIFILHFA